MTTTSLDTIDAAITHLEWRWRNDKNPSPGIRDQIDRLLEQRHMLRMELSGELGHSGDVASPAEWGGLNAA